MKIMSSRKFAKLPAKSHRVFEDWRLAIFLLLCLGLGGASTYVMSLKIPLYYISAGFIGHALLTQKRPLKQLWCPSVILGAVLIGLYGLYLLPLPPGVWSSLSGRARIVESFALTDNPLPWLPLSLTPRMTFESIFNFLPIIAIALMMRLSASQKELKNAERSIIALALISLGIGLIEVLAQVHIFTAYKHYTEGVPIGVFPNINHQASLLAMAVPLALFYIFKSTAKNERRNAPLFAYGFGAMLALAIGLIFTGSGAGYFLLIGNISIALIIMLRKTGGYALLFVLMLVIVAGVVLNFTDFGGHLKDITQTVASETDTSRGRISATTIEASRAFGAFGAGPGAFEPVYRMFERQTEVSVIYVNQAHNEYIQLWLELGYLGIMWMVASAIWLVTKSWSLMKEASSRRKQYMIYGLCILTPILHSAVDYPLRTMALSAIFTYLVIRFDSFGQSDFDLPH